MSFTDREKYIYHLATLMAMQVTHEVYGHAPIKVEEALGLIRKNRCRKLKGEELENIFKDVEEEAMLSSSVYEMDKENKLNNIRDKQKRVTKRFFKFEF